MRRPALFLALLALFVVWTFPHREVVERVLTRRLGGLQADVTMRAVSPSMWPLGYRLDDVIVRGRGYSLTLDSLRLGLGSDSGFDASACGGSLNGRVEAADDRDDGAKTLEIRFDDIDPSSCVDLGSIELSGSFDGTMALESVGGGNPSAVLGRAARGGVIQLEGVQGTLSGHLPRAPASQQPSASAPQPIGSWEFARVGLRAHIDGGDVGVDVATAEAEGLRWEVSAGRLTAGPGSRVRVNAELRARRLDDSPRAKAVLGLLPRATESPEGWRRYRISGTIDAPKIVGLK